MVGRPVHALLRRGRPGARERAAGRAGLGFRAGQRFPGGEPRPVGPGDLRPVGGSARAVPLVHAAAAPGYQDQAGAVHQAGDGRRRGWARRWCARRGCRSRARSAKKSWRSSAQAIATRPDLPRRRRGNMARGASMSSIPIPAGEPTRVIVAGGPDLGTGPIAERLERFRTSLTASAPRWSTSRAGSDAIVGALLCRAARPLVRSRCDLLQQRRLPGDVRPWHHRPDGHPGPPGPHPAWALPHRIRSRGRSTHG